VFSTEAKIAQLSAPPSLPLNNEFFLHQHITHGCEKAHIAQLDSAVPSGSGSRAMLMVIHRASVGGDHGLRPAAKVPSGWSAPFPARRLGSSPFSALPVPSSGCRARSGGSGRRHRFEFHADPVEPAPSRGATPTVAIHIQVELLRKTVRIGDQKQCARRRHVANRADVTRAPVMQNDLPDLRSLVSRNKPSFASS
jgi:hypothetical protein